METMSGAIILSLYMSVQSISMAAAHPGGCLRTMSFLNGHTLAGATLDKV
jgi:hypothetical protein